MRRGGRAMNESAKRAKMCIRDSDLTDPAPATTFAHLDATTVLDVYKRQILWS